MADRAKFLSFLDMIDGGGAGQMGGEFQGGGIFSEIANMIATPYGSEDPRRRDRRRKALGLLDKIGTPEEQAAAASRAAATPSVVKRSVPAVTSSPRPQLRPSAPATDPYAPLGGPNPAVQAEIQRRQEAQRMMEINQPMGAGGRAAGILNQRADPYAPLGGSNPAVAQEIARRRALQANAQRIQSYEPVGPSTIAQPTVPMSAAQLMSVPASGAGYIGAPSGAGVTLGSNMSGGSQPRMPMQEFAPQGQFSPPAESIARMTSSDFAVVDYLERNGIPVTMENVTKYRPIIMAAM
jgi:hypothetical protein